MESRLLIICTVLFLSSCLVYGQEQASVTSDFSEDKQDCTQHPWRGKKIGYIGDFITDPSRYGDNIKRYRDFLKEWLGITPFVYGISERQRDDVPRQAEKLKKEHGRGVDAIPVSMGTNDYNSSMPIGEQFAEQEEQVLSTHGEMKKVVTQKKRTPVMTQGTYRGRVNIGITRLKKLFPDKQIILLTPLYRSLTNFGDKNVQPDENCQNGCGGYIDAYVQAIKEAENIWRIPVIDFNAVANMNPMAEKQLIYFYDVGYDRLHPNTKGQGRMAHTLIYQLLTLSVAF